MKSYVEGKTLRDHLLDAPEFLVDVADPRTAALAGLVARAVEREVFFKSLNAEGLIYAPAEERWEIIDSGTIVGTRSRAEACRGWRDVARGDCTRSSMGLGPKRVREAVVAFLDEHAVGYENTRYSSRGTSLKFGGQLRVPNYTGADLAHPAISDSS